MKAWPVLGIALMQLLLLAAHWFIYRTWIDFWWPLGPWAVRALLMALVLLAFSFIAAALLGFYFANPLVRLFYRLATVWLGLLNFFFMAACLSWLAWFMLRLLRLHPDRPLLAAALFGRSGCSPPAGAAAPPWSSPIFIWATSTDPASAAASWPWPPASTPTLSSSPATSSTARGLMPRS